LDDYKTLYRAGACAAVSVLILMPVQVAVFVAFPLPTTVAEWFALFQRNPIAGLLDMDLLLIVDYVLLAVLFLGLWAALHPASPSLSALAVLLEFLAVSAYFASTTALEMLALSNGYAAAATDAERTAITAAGQALLATWDGTAFTFSYELSAVAVLLVGVAMLRSKYFSRTGAYAGIATGVLSIVPANAGTIGLVLSIVALVPTAIWLSLVSRDLLRLSRVS
jgi:hypothetical protein